MPATVILGSAQTYSALAVTSIANTGATTLSGDVGISPAGSLTGFPPGTIAGATHNGDADAASAQADLLTAYNDAAGRTQDGNFSGDQNGVTFTPGVWRTAAAFALTGTMTIDALGDPNAIFIFQVQAALNTAAASIVSLVNGAKSYNVFWAAVGAVGTGASASFTGVILSLAAITLGSLSTLDGNALSRTTVTLTDNIVTTPIIPMIEGWGAIHM